MSGANGHTRAHAPGGRRRLSIDQRLEMLRSMSEEDLARVEVRGRHDRGDQMPSDHALRFQVRILARAISPESYPILTSNSGMSEAAARMGVSLKYARLLRAKLVDFGLAEQPIVVRRAKIAENDAAVMENLWNKVVQLGPISYEDLELATGYYRRKVEKYSGLLERGRLLRKFVISMHRNGGNAKYGASDLFSNTVMNKVYLMDDSDPKSLERFKSRMLQCCQDSLNPGMLRTISYVLNNLKSVIPGASGTIDQVKAELKKRVVEVKVGA